MGSNSSIPQNNLVVLLHQEDLKKIKLFVEQKNKEGGFDINEPINKMNDTALHYVAHKQNKEIIKYLLQQGAKSNVKNSRQLTPVDVARDTEIKNILLGK